MQQDLPWRKLLDKLMPEFLAFYFPTIHTDIDFSQGVEFLDKDLPKILQKSESEDRFVDKLIRVSLRDGTQKWILIHIEVQGYIDLNFPSRVYTYNYRITDRFGKEVISIALLSDANPNFREDTFQIKRWGFNLLFQFPTVKLLDLIPEWKRMERDTNPFALATMAFLKTLETRGSDQTRFGWKKQFLLELYHRGLERETVAAMYEFIDAIMSLPEEMEDELFDQITQTKEEQKMGVLTTAERIGIAKGRDEGKAEGIAEGKAEGLRETLQDILEIKFGSSGIELFNLLKGDEDLETLQKVKGAVKQTNSVAEAEEAIRHVLSRAT